MDIIRPYFPGTALGLSLKIRFGRPHFSGVSSHEDTIFLIMNTKILTFPPWEKAFIAVVQPSTGH
jgi:hypothetical protein